MARVFIGLGSNIGDRADNVKSALKLMRRKGITPVKESSLYETEPWGVIEQGAFINSVIEADTRHGPFELLGALKSIEVEMGRVTVERWGPRVIDLDILLYENEVIGEQGLVVPHPVMQDRAFVMVPLCEIAPDLVHPVLGKTMKELLSLLDASRVEKLRD